MKTIVLLCVLAMPAVVHSQTCRNYYDGGMQRPSSVCDFYDNQRVAVKLYEDDAFEAYIADPSDPQSMAPDQFKHDGTYAFNSYLYSKDKFRTSYLIVSGNAEKGDIKVYDGGPLGTIYKFTDNKTKWPPVNGSILAYMRIMVALHEARENK